MTRFLTLLWLFFGFLAVNAFSQTKPVPQNEDNLYAVALSACVKKEFEEYGDTSSSGRNFFNRIVEYDRSLTENLPTQFGDFKVEYLNTEDLSQRYKKTRHRLSVFRMFPMWNEGATLKINLSHYYVSVSKRNFLYELEGGCRTEFKFDSPKERIVLSKVELWGV
jgi:hypothetical protein